MRIFVVASFVLASLFALDARSTIQAEPWCSTFGGMNCGYDSFEQCINSIRGVGGSCMRNPKEPEALPVPAAAEQPAPAARPEKKKPQKKPVASVAPQ